MMDEYSSDHAHHTARFQSQRYPIRTPDDIISRDNIATKHSRRRVVKATADGSELFHGNGFGQGENENVEIYHVVARMVQWTHEQKCEVLERLVRESQLPQLRSLSTTLQPALHRGFTYTAQRMFPSIDNNSTSIKLVVSEDNSSGDRSNSLGLTPVRSKTTIGLKSRSASATSCHVTPMPAQRAHTMIGSLNGNGTMMTSLGNRSQQQGDLRAERQFKQFTYTDREQISPTTVTDIYCNRWRELQRNVFFYNLLVNLDERQHYFLSNFLELRLHRDFIADLPRPLAVHILCSLSVQELCTASLVSKKWRHLCKNGTVWRYKYIEQYKEIPSHVTEGDGDQRNWRKIYIKSCSVKDNWTQGNYKQMNCRGHTGRVLCVTMNKTHLATGSVDHTVKLWQISSGTCVQTLKGHVKGVWAVLFFTDNLLISGSYDTSIKIWNVMKGRCLRSLLGHLGPVWALVCRKNILVSVSQDKTGKVWDCSRCLLLSSLEGHKEAVFAVDMDEKDSLILTGSADRTVRLWSSVTGHLLHTLNVSSTTGVMSIAYSNGYMACCYGTTICVYIITLNADVVGGVADVRMLRHYQEHQDRIENLQFKVRDVEGELESSLISAGKDAVIKYWDLTLDNSLRTFNGHKEQINCICFDSTRMASASYDNSIKIWDFFSVVR